jgi:hypothetical protein
MDDERLAELKRVVPEARRCAKERDAIQDSLPIGPTGWPTFSLAQWEEWHRLNDRVRELDARAHELLTQARDN